MTEYLDGATPDDLRAIVEHHLAFCDGCRSVLAEIERVIQLAGRLTEEEDVDAQPDAQREQLMAAFRAGRQAR